MTIAIDLGIDDLRAVFDTEGEANGSMADFPLPDQVRAGAAPRVAHVRAVTGPECRSTRAAMHDYLGRALPPRRAQHLELHLDGCAECIRAFIDIREASWARRKVIDTATLTVTRADVSERLGPRRRR
ncbi:zf-HC2 domain-containing protein [Promicromonospora sp. NPDC050249]|uniref:zf-HC2 domain-containing protein n=1 Tax=Promicromonospora sp. NPDC050249 TaxID=3154743 RepID=UPI0033D5608D